MKRKNILVIVIIIVVAGAGLMWFVGGSSSTSGLTYMTAKVAYANIEHTVTATGTLEPVTQVEVGTQVSGIVSKLYVDYNSEVKKGEVIAELDKTNLLNELASQKSTLANAKTEYDYQLKNYTRSKTLHDKKLVSDTDYETALYNYEKAKNSYNISKNSVAKAETNLGYATITSPIDGVVLDRAVEEGQTVAASFNTPTLFTIANDLTNMQVVADVDETDMGTVAEGQRVTFTVDAFPNSVFQGKVTQVRQQATVTSNVVTYEVVISAPNKDLKLKPGLTATVTIYTMERQHVLSVPSKALQFTPIQPIKGEPLIIQDVKAPYKLWTRNGNTFTAHAVTVGMDDYTRTEIVSGITEGTEIVTEAVFGKAIQAIPTQEDRSPFMPGRPGGSRNTGRTGSTSRR
jgi:HlyD family secretion protein